MVPRIGGKGFSFKGAGDYHLHDRDVKTSERVTWTHAHNLPEGDNKKAIRHMIDTATHADDLKKQAGIKTTGRKSNAHVYTYSLGWKSGEEIDDKTMQQAGIESLKALGLSKHQVLFVRHNDTDHAHVHLIVNRVDPETGVLATLKNDRIKLSKWAQDYELRHGGIQCEARAENNQKRKSEFVKHHEQATRKEYMEEKARGVVFWSQVQKDMKSHGATQMTERKTLFEAKEEKIKALRQSVKDDHKPQWKEIFQAQREEMKEFKAQTHTAWDRAKWLLKYRIEQGQTHGLSQNFKSILDREALYTSIEKRQETDRKELSGQQGNQSRQGMKEINQDYKADRVAMLDKQNDEKSLFDHSINDRISEFKSISNDNEATHESADEGRERTREYIQQRNEPS